ncbi:LysR family transcriptional regulator [Clostridioides difficile]|uniref:LysR family transcriptional regulator n=1 Tax=Clostridioides difficile TaxID=1496 RepID=UPI001C132AB1|nr:LysR family transcriptional regulator [Clostridioides difficile]MDV9720893.1 LysR family transcriptional regulator [Clostridioides difficile]HBF4081905.1 LysR family transcriptional regulator [Clostridioides difficile]HBF4441742.1 LysR family transcriptional regulator [Clostridioides difficile]HBF5906772.1 LysR family transcriptional regulator [Clostridioides difficile]
MEIRVLRYFLAIAREESISGAATFLHITQPTLSRQIMELEEELGVKLLVRGNRKITLTNEGRLLHKRAEEIISLVDKVELEFDNPNEIISGDIHIGSGETEAMRLIAKTAHHFHQKYPNVRYHLFSGNADDVTEKLDKGLLDFGILIEPANIQKYDYTQIPATDVWGLLMRKDSALASQNTINPKDLCNIPLIISRQTLVDKAISKWLQDSNEKLSIVATYNLVYNASLLVEEGLGYALCLDRLVNTTENSNLCFRPLSPPLEAKLNIIWKKHQIFSKAAEKFLLQIQKDFSSIMLDTSKLDTPKEK